MAEEKDMKKKTKKTTTKKTTTTKPKKKTTPKKVEVVEEKKVEVVEEKKDDTILDNVVDTVKDVADAATAPVVEIMHGNIPKKPSAIIYLLVLFFLGLIVILSIYSYFHPLKELKTLNFSYIGLYEEPMIYDDYYRISTEKEFETIFPDQKEMYLDFDQYQYVVLGLTYDSCREKNIKISGYEMQGSTMKVTIEYEASCGLCAPQYVYYLLKLNKDLVFDDLTYDYVALNNPHCRQDIAYKPMIYLYPTKEVDVTVQLGNPDVLLTTYPPYQDGWRVTAYPDGTLKDENREYYGLFWEGDHHPTSMKKDGFVVKGKDTLSFLEEKLKVLGLNDQEANEFIVYWYPILKQNEYNYIRFETMDEINRYMPLTITPEPQSIIRIQMDYKPLTKPISVAEQTLTTPVREGFTVVEWGGSKIKD